MPENEKNGKLIFIKTVVNHSINHDSFKITLSKPREKDAKVVNVYIKPSLIKGEVMYSFTYRYTTKDEVKNYKQDQLEDMIRELLNIHFYNAVLYHETKELTLLQNNKGKASLVSKYLKSKVEVETTHDHQKIRYIDAGAAWLKDLGIAGADGKILDKAQDKYKQINRYIELLDHLLSGEDVRDVTNIADMGSGKGYLTFALYDFLVNYKNWRVKISGYELREDLATMCYNIAMKNDFIGLNFQQKSIEDVSLSNVDMVVALHACDIATDMAIAKGIQADARFIVVAPCCHKQVRLAMKHSNQLTPILKYGILEERLSELLTDGIRALMLEAYGYKTQVIEFVSHEHTAKNIMITAVKKSGFDASHIEKVEAVRKLFGIEYHHLQRLMDDWEKTKGTNKS